MTTRDCWSQLSSLQVVMALAITYQPSHGAPIKVPNWLCRCELSCCHMAVAELVVALPFCCTRLFVLH